MQARRSVWPYGASGQRRLVFLDGRRPSGSVRLTLTDMVSARDIASWIRAHGLNILRVGLDLRNG